MNVNSSKQISRLPSLAVFALAFDEAENIPGLCRGLCEVLVALAINWSWIFEDAHSNDGSFRVLRELAVKDDHVRAVQFALNAGSHVVTRCSHDYYDANCTAVIASDMQDPAETIPPLLEKWRAGAQIIGFGAVVSTCVPPYAIVAGVPTRFLRWRAGHCPPESQL